MQFQKKAMYKYEVAALLGVSMTTFSRLINERYYEKLKAIEYRKTQKMLTPAQILMLNGIMDFLE